MINCDFTLLDKSLQKGTIWTIIFFLVSFAKTIVLTPLMLLHWGADGFSFWAIILSARAIILFLSDGFVRYIVNQYNLLFHADEEKAKTVLSSGISFLIVFSIGLCVFTAVLFGCVNSTGAYVFNVPIYLSDYYLSACLIIFIIAACVQTIQRMYAAVMEARGLVWKNMVVEVVLIAVEIIVLSILLFYETGFREAVFADSAIIFAVGISYLSYIGFKYPLGGILKKQSVKAGASAFAKATQLYAGNFFEKLSTDGLVLLLSFFRFDRVAIALFATIRTIVNTPLLAQNLLLNTYTPQLQKDFALRNNKGLKKLFTFIRLRVGLVLLAGIVFCYPLYEPIFIYWTKGKIDYNETFMVAMLMMAVFNLYGISFAYVLKGLNVLPQMLGVMLIKTLLLIIGFYFAQQNIAMVGWTMVSAEFVCSVILLPLLLHRFWKSQGFAFDLSENFLQLTPYFLAAICLFLRSL